MTTHMRQCLVSATAKAHDSAASACPFILWGHHLSEVKSCHQIGRAHADNKKSWPHALGLAAKWRSGLVFLCYDWCPAGEARKWQYGQQSLHRLQTANSVLV